MSGQRLAREERSREARGRLRVPVAAVPPSGGIVESLESSGAGSVFPPIQLRHRESLVQKAATRVNHMQKALDLMNVKWQQMMSDIVGQTGLAIVDARLGGERIKASKAVIAKSMVGDLRHQHLFTRKQSRGAYRSYQKMIDDCDWKIRLQRRRRVLRAELQRV